MSKKRNPQYAVKHESWSSNVHKSHKHYDRNKANAISEIEGYEDDYVWDLAYDRLVWGETAIEMIIQNELSDEEHEGKTYEEVEKEVLDNLSQYFAFYDYEEV